MDWCHWQVTHFGFYIPVVVPSGYSTAKFDEPSFHKRYETICSMVCKWDTWINRANLRHLAPGNPEAWFITVPISVEYVRYTARDYISDHPRQSNRYRLIFSPFFLLYTLFTRTHLVQHNFFHCIFYSQFHIHSQHTNIQFLLIVALSKYGGVQQLSSSLPFFRRSWTHITVIHANYSLPRPSLRFFFLSH